MDKKKRPFPLFKFFIIIFMRMPIHTAVSPFKYQFYDVIYGSKYFKDIYIPPDMNTTEEEDYVIDDDSEEDKDFSPFIDLDIMPITGEHDLVEFNKISKGLPNMTRRLSWDYFYGHDDPEDRWYEKVEYLEPQKKKMLMTINLQFLVHSRYKVYAALDQCNPFRGDKRYRLGYLFNRIRRLQYEMRKAVSIASYQNQSYWLRSLHSLMRIYEKVVRFDIDIRDTSDLIREVYNTQSAADAVTNRPTKPGGAGGGPH